MLIMMSTLQRSLMMLLLCRIAFIAGNLKKESILMQPLTVQNPFVLLSWTSVSSSDIRIPEFLNPSLYDDFLYRLKSSLALNSCVFKFYGVTTAPSVEKIGDAKLNITSYLIQCYFISNVGSITEKRDAPKTNSLMIYCPIPRENSHLCQELDMETHAALSIENGATTHSTITVLYPPSLQYASPILRSKYSSQSNSYVVCAVQTFQNRMTGPQMFLFVEAYIKMGWTVVIFDRYGRHRQYIEHLLSSPQLNYHPYTILEKILPSYYGHNRSVGSLEGGDMEESGVVVNYISQRLEGIKRHGVTDRSKSFTGQLSETASANLNSDKFKTYDHVRLEYSHARGILFVDIDEVLLCPQGTESLQKQKETQQLLLDRALLGGGARNVDEMRIIRRVYHPNKFLADTFPLPAGFVDTHDTAGTEHRLGQCLRAGYQKRSIADMFGCWGSNCQHQPWDKSMDITGTCPFHWAHFSCHKADNLRHYHRCTCNTTKLHKGLPLVKEHLRFVDIDKYASQD